MLIDFHTHIFPDRIAEKTIALLSEKGNIPAYSNGTLVSLQRALNDVNAYMGISLPVLTRPESFESILHFAMQVNEGFFKKEHDVLSFAGIHPDCDDVEGKMARIKACGFLGVKIHPDYQQTFIDDPKYIRILNAAIDQDLIVVTHAGFDVGYPELTHCTPERALRAIRQLKGDCKLVIAHCGGCRMHEEAYELLAGENVYFDTAYVLPEIEKETFLKILKKHGADKILFASDNPWQNIRNSYEILQSFGLDKETEEKILYKNALSLLGSSVIRK